MEGLSDNALCRQAQWFESGFDALPEFSCCVVVERKQEHAVSGEVAAL